MSDARVRPDGSRHRIVVGVMGAGQGATPAAMRLAEDLGRAIAARGWVLLCGGRAAGVMDAAARGAAQAGGLVVGLLPGRDRAGASRHLDLALPTGLGDARNALNVLASDIVLACEGGAGTLSEVALALKAGRTVIAVGWSPGAAGAFEAARRAGTLLEVPDAEGALRALSHALPVAGRA